MATISKYALLSGSTCVGVILWDGVTPYDPSPYAVALYNPAVHVVATDPRLVNKATLSANALAALAANLTFINLASPTTAQVAAQVKALTRQVDAVIKILLDQLDDTTGT